MERAPSRRQECRQRLVVDDVLEQIHEPNVSKSMLRLGRTRRQDRQSLRARVLHTRIPERRLPDPLDYERGRSAPRVVDKGLEGAELLLPTNDSMAIHLANNVAVTTRKASLDLPALLTF